MERPNTVLPLARRVVAIGDVHGDYAAALRAIKLAKVIDENHHWNGADTVLVQVGDQTDRGDSEKEIIDFLELLRPQAIAAGGDVIVLNGNHETKNVSLDFGYVTRGGAKKFSYLYDAKKYSRDRQLRKFKRHLRGRVIAFRPGGIYAKILSTHNTIVIIGKTLFVHGGVTPKYARYGIDKINEEIEQWMKGDAHKPRVINDSNGPLWSRVYSKNISQKGCALLDETLDVLALERMVVAHTVQKNAINSACNNKVWRIDTGMSSYYGGRSQVLEIINDSQLSILE